MTETDIGNLDFGLLGPDPKASTPKILRGQGVDKANEGGWK